MENKKRIAFAGAPKCGKTAVMKRLAQLVAPEYKDKVSFISEAATEFIRLSPELVRDPSLFQEIVYRHQNAEEDRLASEDCLCTVTDRGLPDAYVYLGSKALVPRWLLRRKHSFNRYGLVIYFNELGDVKPDGNDDTVRVEDSEAERMRISRRTRRIWKHCKNIVYVDPFDSIEEKTRAVGEILNEYLGLKVFIIK